MGCCVRTQQRERLAFRIQVVGQHVDQRRSILVHARRIGVRPRWQVVYFAGLQQAHVVNADSALGGAEAQQVEVQRNRPSGLDAREIDADRDRLAGRQGAAVAVAEPGGRDVRGRIDLAVGLHVEQRVAAR